MERPARRSAADERIDPALGPHQVLGRPRLLD
jgi:hypothetical protein